MGVMYENLHCHSVHSVNILPQCSQCSSEKIYEYLNSITLPVEDAILQDKRIYVFVQGTTGLPHIWQDLVFGEEFVNVIRVFCKRGLHGQGNREVKGRILLEVFAFGTILINNPGRQFPCAD